MSLMLLSSVMVGFVAADFTTPESIIAAEKVSVYEASDNPAVFFSGGQMNPYC
ncbi:MAG: hypothetical protein WCF90_09400 [Methanomicrobiales archaeon]